MDKNKTKNKSINDIIPAIAFSALLFVVSVVFFDLYYDLNDDSAIRNILSGAFTGEPEAMTVYVNFVLSFLISGFYRIIPSVSWFGAFELICLYSSFALAIFYFNRKIDRLYAKVIASFGMILFIASLLLYQTVYIQYTSVSGIIAGIGALIFYLSDDEKNTGKFIVETIPAVLYEVIAFMLRDKMFLLLLPLIGTLYILKWITGSKAESGNDKITKLLFKKETLIKYFVPLFVVIIACGICLVTDKAVYSSEGWKEYSDFNEVRTLLFDYQCSTPSYSECPDIYDKYGIQEKEASLLAYNMYNFGLSDKTDTELLTEITDYNSNVLGIGQKDIHYITDILKDYVRMIFKNNICEYSYIILALYVLFTVAIVFLKKYKYLFFEAAMIFARSLSFIYLLYGGRIKDRVLVPLCFAEILLIASVMIKISVESKKKTAIIVFSTALLLICVSHLPVTLKKTVTEMKSRDEVNITWNNLLSYMNENNDSYYVLNTMSTVDYSEKIHLNSGENVNNFEIDGGWLVKTPVYNEKLLYFGIDNITDALANNDKVKYVIKDTKETGWLTEYLEEKGYDVTLTEEDSDDERTKGFRILNFQTN